MKKLTAGIFTVLIGLCAANSADATVASSAWVNEKVNALSTTVSNNATTAAAATQAVADDLAEYIESNDAAVALKADQTDLDATNTLVGTLPADAGATTIVGYIQKKTEGIATDAALTSLTGRVSTNEGKLTTLQGTGEGSVSKSIADALASYTNTEGVNAKVKVVSDALDAHVTTAASTYQTLANIAKSTDKVLDANKETMYPSEERMNLKIADAVSKINADIDTQGTALDDFKGEVKTGFDNVETALGTKADKTVVEGLATTVSNNATTAAAATQAVADDLDEYITSNDTAVSANTSAIAAINNADTGILKLSKDYTDAEISELSNSLSGTSGDLTALTGRVDTAEGKITTLEGTVGNAEGGLVKDVADNAAAAKAAADAAAENLAKINAQAALISTNATNISNNADAIEAEVARAKAAEEANATAAQNAQATANAAIPKPQGVCTNAEYKCVLTYNNETYTWEVIERANGEVVE